MLSENVTNFVALLWQIRPSAYVIAYNYALKMLALFGNWIVLVDVLRTAAEAN